ncbi:hypothetical protein [Clostridium formicaceticum]|uniref:Uncharacterized protein n=1 Tax=Clostridium formicaceticum TaxID=1497 RepID=A0AAC9RKV1_9CLOT|nr:hypothetical protein [Clostridium formicaceticum]AOY77020.1 hypothetical protein BJL90_14865 [Clostridium formicaceticum]ARE87517.1 hypothetical protein CLFO_19170 [Clostridium formicaceticum]
MKKFLLMGLIIILGSSLVLGGCTTTEESEEVSVDKDELVVSSNDNIVVTYDNGRYRGTYGDRGDQQISIEFHLEDNIIKDLSYRHL